jgi:hypothetical protein
MRGLLTGEEKGAAAFISGQRQSARRRSAPNGGGMRGSSWLGRCSVLCKKEKKEQCRTLPKEKRRRMG